MVRLLLNTTLSSTSNKPVMVVSSVMVVRNADVLSSYEISIAVKEPLLIPIVK